MEAEVSDKPGSLDIRRRIPYFLLSGSLQCFYQVILLFLFRFSLLIILHVKVVICIRHFAVIITSEERVLLVIWFS